MNQPVNFNQQETLVSAPQESREYKMPKKHKGRTLKRRTAIKKCSVTFKLVKDFEDQYILKVNKINDVPVIKRTEESNTEQLPVTSLLEQWEVEVRERSSGALYRVYFHPRSSRKYRSLIKVSKFIEDNYYPNSSVKLQIRPQKERISLNGMAHIISASDSLNEEVQSHDKQDVTEDEVQVAKILAYDLGKYVAFNMKMEPKD